MVAQEVPAAPRLGTAAGRRRTGPLMLAAVGIVLIARSAVIMVYLTFAYARQVDPLSKAASYYVFTEGRNTFDSAAIGVALGCVAILIGLRGAGMAVGGAAVALSVSWAALLVAAVMFTVDQGGRIETVHGAVHQVAGAGIFALLPAAGLVIAPRLAASADFGPVAHAVRQLSIVAAVGAVLYPVSRLPELFFSDTLGRFNVSGVIQRLAFAVEIAVLLVIAVRLLQVSRARVPVAVQPRDEIAT